MQSTQYLGWGMTPQAATNVTPFTYRDNLTFLELLHSTIDKTNDIIDAINANAASESVDVAAINAQYTALIAHWNATLATLDPTHVSELVIALTGEVSAAVADAETALTTANASTAAVAALNTTLSAALAAEIATARAAEVAARGATTAEAATARAAETAALAATAAEATTARANEATALAATVAEAATARAAEAANLAAIVAEAATARFNESRMVVGTYVKSTGVKATDTANIMAAHDAFSANGGTILLDSGPYRWTAGGVNFTKPIHLMGSGPSAPSTTVYDTTYVNSGSLIECDSNTGIAIRVNADGCSFEKLSLINTAPTTPVSGAGIRIETKGMSSSLSHCTISKFFINLEFVQGYEWDISFCHIHDFVWQGIRIQNTAVYDGGDGVITGCSIMGGPTNNTPEAGISWGSGGGLKVFGNKINSRPTVHMQCGIHFNVLDGGGTSVAVITGNSIENIDYGVLVTLAGPLHTGDFKYITITGNQVWADVYGFGIVPEVAGKIHLVNITGNVGYGSTAFVALGNVDRITLGANVPDGTYYLLVNPVTGGAQVAEIAL
jgi:hypothetical protein